MLRSHPLGIVLVALTAASGLALASWHFAILPDWWQDRVGVGPPLAGPHDGYSNILPEDYVGPDACGKCHKAEHKLWSKHPHRFMNQWASPQSVKGDFSGVTWEPRPGYSVRFHTSDDGAYLMSITRPGKKGTRYRVTRTVGSRFMQFYIGVQEEGAEPREDRRYTVEHKLPFGYWLRLARWLPVDYFDAGGGDGADYLRDGIPVLSGVDEPYHVLAYSRTCVHCHTTYPHAYRVFHPGLEGFPDAVLRPDPARMSQELARWVDVRPTRAGLSDLLYRVDPKDGLVTIGISCESCHLGGREHATRKNKPSFFPTHPGVQVLARHEDREFLGHRDDPATSQGVCAQCHSARGVAMHPNGARKRNSAESMDMADGHCISKIKCTTCHEPHTPGPPSGGPVVPAHVQACVECHGHLASPEQQAAHARHRPESGVTCLDCHMPRITQGLDEMMRTHRISHPVERSMATQGAPNACNLCHLDRPIRWAVEEVRKGWGQKIELGPAAPDPRLSRPAGELWLESREMIERMIAVDSYSRLPDARKHLPTIMGVMNDRTSVVRIYAVFAAERVLGRRIHQKELDVSAGPATRKQQIDLLLREVKGER
jgi:hypothetical protein